MPTFAAIAFDRLLEPSSHNQKPPQAPVEVDQPIRNRQVSPALYATPETTPLPPDSSASSPSSFSPVSPYIINHKRRGPRLLNDKTPENIINGGVQLPERVEEEKGKELEIEEVEEELENDNVERESDVEDFFEFNESMSNISEDGTSNERSFKPGTPNGEFYDAFEEISSDVSSNRGNSIEEELREMRLSLLMEIEKRKQAEESFEILKNQWSRLSHHLSLLGYNLPPPLSNSKSNFEFEFDPVVELYKQIVVSRVVNDAICRGISRAEVAEEIESVIQAKNFEISRLVDRVQYYEAANREMNQRNQEAIEMARQERNKKKRRQKWFYASIGLAVTLSSAAIAWSFLPASTSVQTDHEESSSSTISTASKN